MTLTPPAVASCLLVDDHPLICEAVRTLIDSQPALAVVGAARCGETALELLRELRPAVALVDAVLPTGMDGCTVVRRAREEQLPTRIVIYSANDGGSHVRRGFDSGAFGYVSKTSPFDRVVSALLAAADGQRYVDPQLAAELIAPTGPLLSPREGEVLTLLATGMQNDGIAYDLGIAAETVKTHVSRLIDKLGSHSRTGAVAVALRSGLIA